MNFQKACTCVGLMLVCLSVDRLRAQSVELTERIGQADGDVLHGVAFLPDGSIVAAGTFDAKRTEDKKARMQGGRGEVFLVSNKGERARETAGGNAMWHQMGDDLKTKAPFVVGDQFQRASNTAAAHLTAVVRLDPLVGVTENKLATTTKKPEKSDPNGDGFVIVGTLPKNE